MSSIMIQLALLICLPVYRFLDADGVKRGSDVFTLDTVKAGELAVATLEQLDIENPGETADKCSEHSEFYPANYIARVNKVRVFEDCMLLCYKQPHCIRIGYAHKLNTCYMFSGYIHNRKTMTTIHAISCVIADYHRKKKQLIEDNLPDGNYPEGQSCGVPHFSFTLDKRQKRFVNGKRPPFYSVPWAVSLRHSLVGGHLCSGTLLTCNHEDTQSRYVITAAHCFIKLAIAVEKYEEAEELENPHFTRTPEAVTVIAGSYDSRFTEAHEQESEIEHIISLIKHDQTNYYQVDIAILIMKNHFKFNHFVQPVCLPEKINETIPQPESCYAAGWGDEEWRILFLKKVGSPTSMLAIRGYFIKMSDNDNTMMVIGARKTYPYGDNSSPGNSGSALFCKDQNGKFIIYGVLKGWCDEKWLKYLPYKATEFVSVSLLLNEIKCIMGLVSAECLDDKTISPYMLHYTMI